MAADMQLSFLEQQIVDIEARMAELKAAHEEYIILEDVLAALIETEKPAPNETWREWMRGPRKGQMDDDILAFFVTHLKGTTAEIAEAINRPVTSVARACKRMQKAGKLIKEEKLWTRR